MAESAFALLADALMLVRRPRSELADSRILTNVTALARDHKQVSQTILKRTLTRRRAAIEELEGIAVHLASRVSVATLFDLLGELEPRWREH